MLRVCRLLNRHRVRYVLAGGVAANLHGSVRATVDVDILVPRDLANLARLLRALGELPYGPPPWFNTHTGLPFTSA